MFAEFDDIFRTQNSIQIRACYPYKVTPMKSTLSDVNIIHPYIHNKQTTIWSGKNSIIVQVQSFRVTIHLFLWICSKVFPKIVVYPPPNHPILIGFSIINHPFFGNTPMDPP